jgi:hypothetical protein
MAPIMIGTKILKRVRVSLFQGTQKLKKASLRESLKDYRRDASNIKRVNQTPSIKSLEWTVKDARLRN